MLNPTEHIRDGFTDTRVRLLFKDSCGASAFPRDILTVSEETQKWDGLKSSLAITVGPNHPDIFASVSIKVTGRKWRRIYTTSHIENRLTVKVTYHNENDPDSTHAAEIVVPSHNEQVEALERLGLLTESLEEISR
jgi:hypothetical protein